MLPYSDLVQSNNAGYVSLLTDLCPSGALREVFEDFHHFIFSFLASWLRRFRNGMREARGNKTAPNTFKNRAQKLHLRTTASALLKSHVSANRYSNNLVYTLLKTKNQQTSYRLCLAAHFFLNRAGPPKPRQITSIAGSPTGDAPRLLFRAGHGPNTPPLAHSSRVSLKGITPSAMFTTIW